jgi:hypothetical protein
VKNICFINGSLRGREASSLVFLNFINRLLGNKELHKDILNVRVRENEGDREDRLRSIARADAIIMVFPLFTYGIPGALMRLLEDFYVYAKRNGYNKAAVYMVANCGFPRPQIMGELIRVMKNFCRRLSFNWRFAVCIGGGPVAAMTVKVPLLNMKYQRAFAAIVADIENGDTEHKEDYFIKPLIPEPIALWIKARYEKKMKAGAATKSKEAPENPPGDPRA